MKKVYLFRISLALASLLFILPSGAESPPAALRGHVLLSDKRFPVAAASPAALRKQSKTSFIQDKQTKNWKIYIAAFLRDPLAGNEYKIKVYDDSGKARSLLVTQDQFADARGRETLFAEITLEPRQVGVNKQLLIHVEDTGAKILGSAQLKIIGESPKFSGKVEFKEE